MNGFLFFITIDAFQICVLLTIMGFSVLHTCYTMKSNAAIPTNITFVLIVIPEAILIHLDPQPLSIIYKTDDFIFAVLGSILTLLVNIHWLYCLYEDRKYHKSFC